MLNGSTINLRLADISIVTLALIVDIAISKSNALTLIVAVIGNVATPTAFLTAFIVVELDIVSDIVPDISTAITLIFELIDVDITALAFLTALTLILTLAPIVEVAISKSKAVTLIVAVIGNVATPTAFLTALTVTLEEIDGELIPTAGASTPATVTVPEAIDNTVAKSKSCATIPPST